MQRAFVDGAEVFQVVLNAICPVAHAQQARESTLAYLQQYESTQATTTEHVLNINLGPIGSTEVTHVFCSRRANTDQISKSLRMIHTLGFPWCGRVPYSVDGSIDDLLSKFCVVVGEKDALLSHLGLEVKA